MLSTARNLGRERVYLLVKLFATTGFHLEELPKVTVESVRAGVVSIVVNGIEEIIEFPGFLQRELLSFAGRNGIVSGPIFLVRSGKPMSRSDVAILIQQLCEAAQVPKEKGNSRCLRKLYLSTRAEIEAKVALLIEQAVQQQLERKQESIGWETQ